MEYLRIKNDVNGNPRFVVHFLAFNDAAEIQSTFLSWAGQEYNIALMRAKGIGARIYRGKDFGGGFVIQSYRSTREHDVKKAFEIFESSATAQKGEIEIRLTVMNDFDFYSPCKTAIERAFKKGADNLPAARAFAEVLHQCNLCAQKARKQFGTRISQDAIFYGACLVCLSIEHEVTGR